MKIDTLYIGGKFIGHDSSVFTIFPEEKEVFGIATERLTRFKHDNLHPIPAISKLLEYKKINPLEVKKVFYANPFTSQKDQKFLKNRYELQQAERRHFQAAYKNELADKLVRYEKLNIFNKIINLSKTGSGREMLKERMLNRLFKAKIETLDTAIKKNLRKIFPMAEIDVIYYDHEYCHAISSYYTSPYEKAILFTFDGWGDGDFSKVYIADNGKINLLAESLYSSMDLGGQFKKYFCSIGGIYTYFTAMLGFQPESDEGKVEALAAFGHWQNEVYENLMKMASIDREKMTITMNSRLAEEYLHYDNMQKLLVKFKREDLAAAVQKFLENTTLPYIKLIIEKSGINNLCLSGGVMANVILNLGIYEKITKNIHIVPAMADDGTSQGAAISLLLDNGYNFENLKWLKDEIMPYYATSYSHDEVLAEISKINDKINFEDLGNSWPDIAAELLAAGKIGAIFQGRMEWGPRALGNRSIIADPRRPEFRDKINKEIKRRPLFQPFCPSVLAEEKDRLFEDAYLNKHMTCAFRMKKEFHDKLPSAIHIDGTARVQFVEEKDNPNYYRLLKKVKELTGFGVVINTSFNKHGRTIVESPEDAITDFLDTDMDYLIIEGIKISRK